MGLPDKNIEEVDLVAPAGIQLLHWLDRADGDRSCERAEVKQHGLIPQAAQADSSAADPWQLEIRCDTAWRETSLFHGAPDIRQQMAGAEVREVVLADGEPLGQGDELPLRIVKTGCQCHRRSSSRGRS
jgi:hypothetical protein